MPDPHSPLPDVSKLDPFSEEIDNVRHAPRVKKRISKNGHASSKGYIKFQLRYIPNSPQSRGNRRSLVSSDQDRDPEQTLTPPPPFNIPRLLANLDKLAKLDLKDERLLKFCKTSVAHEDFPTTDMHGRRGRILRRPDFDQTRQLLVERYSSNDSPEQMCLTLRACTCCHVSAGLRPGPDVT